MTASSDHLIDKLTELGTDRDMSRGRRCKLAMVSKQAIEGFDVLHMNVSLSRLYSIAACFLEMRRSFKVWHSPTQRKVKLSEALGSFFVGSFHKFSLHAMKSGRLRAMVARHCKAPPRRSRSTLCALAAKLDTFLTVANRRVVSYSIVARCLVNHSPTGALRKHVVIPILPRPIS